MGHIIQVLTVPFLLGAALVGVTFGVGKGKGKAAAAATQNFRSPEGVLYVETQR